MVVMVVIAVVVMVVIAVVVMVMVVVAVTFRFTSGQRVSGLAQVTVNWGHPHANGRGRCSTTPRHSPLVLASPPPARASRLR